MTSARMTTLNAELAAVLRDQGYTHVRVMPDGGIAGIRQLPAVCWLVSELDFEGNGRRWCFEKLEHAERALATWNGVGNPPGPWVKRVTP